jgi:DNA-binding transcriptional ArsR family regulator
MDEHADELFEIHARFCSVFSNPKRLKIMWLIGDQDKSVGEIAKEAGLPESAVSQHLRVMKDRNAVVSRKDGRTVYYRVSNRNFLKGLKHIRAGLIEEYEKKSKTMRA